MGSAQPLGYDVQNSLNEVKDGLNAIKRDISATAQRLAAQQPATNCPTNQCLSTTFFAVFMIIQIVIMIGYFIYRLVAHQTFASCLEFNRQMAPSVIGHVKVNSVLNIFLSGIPRRRKQRNFIRNVKYLFQIVKDDNTRFLCGDQLVLRWWISPC